jgi:hypothetical protein
MLALTNKESDCWLANNGVNENHLIHDDQYFRFVYSIPVDSGVKNYIAKRLSAIFEKEKVFLRITDFGVFSASENRELFHGYRRSLGVEQEIHEKPAHIFDEGENIELYCILSMVLYFIWGSIVVNESKQIIIYISHDEFIDIYIRRNCNRDIIEAVKSIFTDSSK